MNRRNFLAGFFGGTAAIAAAVAIDPEILLWTPGAKTIFLPGAPIPITVDYLYGTRIEYSLAEHIMTIDDLRVRYIMPAAKHYFSQVLNA